MKNKITIVLVLIMMILPQRGSAAAAVLNEPQIQQDETVLISGSIGSSLKRGQVTVTVFFDSKTDADITEGDNKGTIAFIKKVQSEPDGTFSVLWEPEKNGMYDIKAVSAGGICVLEDFWYTSLKELKRLQKVLLEGSSEDIAEALNDEDSLNTLEINTELLKGRNVQNTAEALVALREYNKETTDAVQYVEDAVKLARFKSEKSEEAFSLYAEILEKYDVPFDNKAVYNALDNSSVKSSVLENFSKKSTGKLEAANDELKAEIILSGTEKSLWSECEKYLLMIDEKILDGCGSKSYVLKNTAGKRYSSLSELQSSVEKLVKDSKKEQSGGKSSTGGTGGGKNISMKLETTGNDNKASEEAVRKVFSDVPESHWAFDAVNYLRWNNIVNGDTNNSFNPEKNVSRAELVKMLVCAFNIKGSTCDFADVNSGDWFYGYVAAAFTKGLINGDGVNFRPNDDITRQDAAVIIFRFAENSGKKYIGGDLTFEDADSISDYAKNAVAALCSDGTINGIDGKRFAPQERLTRAQCAKMIYGIITEREVLQ